MNVLVVAPKTDLVYVENEVQSVVNLLGARVLRGHVTLPDLLERLQSRRWDVIWFTTHGSKDGILLSDGVAQTSLLIPLINSSGATLVVVNTCSSLQVAMAISAQLSVELICTIDEVPDRTAFVNGATLAFHLANGLSPERAWGACGINLEHPLLWLPSSSHDANPIIPLPAPVVDKVSGELTRIIALIDGDPKWNVTGIIPTINLLVEQLEGVKRSLIFLRAAFVLLLLIILFTMATTIYIIQVILPGIPHL